MQKKSIYERHFEEVTAQTDAMYGRKTYGELIEALYAPKDTEPVEIKEPTFDFARKNAIVMIGQSCSGKTKFAKHFIKEFPEFEYISMDECAIEEMDLSVVETMSTEEFMQSDIGVKTFARKVEKGTNIIIDGEWMSLNCRLALLRTLWELGYYTYAFSFLGIPGNVLVERLKSRALMFTAKNMLGQTRNLNSDIDWIDEYSKHRRITLESAIKELAATVNFAREFEFTRDILISEIEMTDINAQVQVGVVFMGFDELYQVPFN